MVTSDDFYAIYSKDARAGSYRVYLFRANPYRFGEWDRTPYQVNLDADMADPAVAVGRNFAAVADAAAGQLKIVAWNQELNQWTERAFSTARANQVALAAGPNCCVGAYYTTGSQSLQCAMYYADAEGRWTYGDSYTETVPMDWEVTTPQSLLSMGSSFVAVTFIKAVDTTAQKATYGVRILPWSESFQFGQVYKGDYQQGLTINNPIAYSVVQQSVVGNGQHLFRFDGARWQPCAAADPVAGRTYTYAHGSDVAVSAVKDSAGSVAYSLFDYSPYDNAWHGPKPAGEPVAAGDGLAAPTVSGDYRTTGRTVYYRTPTLAWEPIHTMPQSANLETVQNRAPSYLAYQDTGNTATYVLLIQNGSVSPAQELAGARIVVDQAGPGEILAGPNAFVTYRGNSFAQAAALSLYRVVNASISQYQTDRSVVQLEISDGYGVQETRFQYDYDTATYDPYGLVTQFVRAVVQSAGAAGWTEHIFFNGLNPSVDGVVYPPSDEFTNVRNYFSKVSGQLFRSTAFAADKRKVRTSTNYLYTYTAGNSDYRCLGALVRQRKTVEGVAAFLFDGPATAAADLDQRRVPADLRGLFADRGFPLTDPVTVTIEAAGRLWTVADGVGQEYQALLDGGRLPIYGWRYDVAEAEYNARGQVARTIAHNVDSDGEPETLVTETTYAWEVYPELAQMNCLTPVAQSRTVNASRNVVTGSHAITYTRDWDGGAGGPWAPRRMYAWAGGQDQAVFAHAAVAAGADPGPDWIRTAEVLAVTPRALPVVTADLDGNLGGSLFDSEQRFAVAVAAGANPLAGEVTYFGFEAYEDAGIWSVTPAGTNPADYINAGDAFTGERRLIIPGDPARHIGLPGTLAPANGSQPFLLSCWIKTAPGFVADPALSAWEIRVTGTGGPAPPLLVPLPATGERWQYFHTIIDPAVLQVGPITRLAMEVYSRQDHQYLLVDDVFCVPLHGRCRAAVYDPFDKSLLAKVDNLGNVRRFAYDHLRRPVAEMGDGDVPRSLWVDYLWRQHHEGAFDPADPSASLMAAPRGGGTYTDFRHGDEWQAAWSASTGWAAGEGGLRFAGGARGSLAFRDGAIHANYGIRFMLTYGEPVDQPIGFSLGSAFTAQWQNGAWELLDGQGNRLDTAPQPVLDSRDLLLLAGSRGVMLLANGRRVAAGLRPRSARRTAPWAPAN